MNLLVYVISLPIAVATIAALLSVRDGANGSWSLLRATFNIGALLLIVWFTGGTTLAWVGYAFATVLVLHLSAFYLGRWIFVGLK